MVRDLTVGKLSAFGGPVRRLADRKPTDQKSSVVDSELEKGVQKYKPGITSRALNDIYSN